MRWDSKLCRKLMDNSILATGAKIVALVFLSYLTLGNWIAEQYYLSHVREENLGLSKYLLELPQGSISLSNLSSSAQQNLHWPLETSFTKTNAFPASSAPLYDFRTLDVVIKAQPFTPSYIDISHIVWKLLKLSHLNFYIVAFPTNFC